MVENEGRLKCIPVSFTEEDFVSTFFHLERKNIGPEAEIWLIVLVLA